MIDREIAHRPMESTPEVKGARRHFGPAGFRATCEYTAGFDELHGQAHVRSRAANLPGTAFPLQSRRFAP